MNFCCIADEDTVRGFRLAGIAGRVVGTAGEAEAAVREVADEGECGVLIVTEQVTAQIQSMIDEIRLQRDRPLILEIPGPSGPTAGRRSLRQLVEEAAGLRFD